MRTHIPLPIRAWLISEAKDCLWSLTYCTHGLTPSIVSRLNARAKWIADLLTEAGYEGAEVLIWLDEVKKDHFSRYGADVNPDTGNPWNRTYGIHVRWT